MTTALVPQQPGTLNVASAALTIQEIVSQKQLIAQAMQELMKEGEHYGTIPGAKKPSLWKPGADLICSMFQLDADYIAEEVIHRPDYIYYRYKCVLTHIPTGRRVGSGLGSCNSREEKYRRPAAKKCPGCEKETIFRSKPRNKQEEQNPDALGWYCWSKKGGCGRNFVADDPTIIHQDNGLADPSDLDNTILKMTAKRSRIDAVLTVTAAGDFFSQDLEDLSERAKRLVVVDGGAEYIPPQAKEGSGPKGAAGSSEPPKPSPTRSTANGSPSNSFTSGQTTTQTTTTTTNRSVGTSRAPRANTVKHDGTFASPKQVQLLHVLKGKVGGLTEEMYRKQLAAFKDCDGKPITTSKDLSEAQISNLLDRYQAQIDKQAKRAAEQPDIGAVVSVEDRKDLDELEAAFRGSQLTAQELCSLFNVDNLGELDREQSSQALALVMAHGTKTYHVLLDRIFGGEREPGAEG